MTEVVNNYEHRLLIDVVELRETGGRRVEAEKGGERADRAGEMKEDDILGSRAMRKESKFQAGKKRARL